MITYFVFSFDCHCQISDLCKFSFFWCWKGLSGWLSGQIVFLEAPSSEDWATSIKAVERDPHFFGSGSLSPSIHYLTLVDGFQNLNIGNYGKTWRTCETHEICFVYVLPLFVGLFVCWVDCLFDCLFVGMFHCFFLQLHWYCSKSNPEYCCDECCDKIFKEWEIIIQSDASKAPLQ